VDRKVAVLPFLFLALITIEGCVGSDAGWSFSINGNASASINSTLYERLINCSQTYDGATGIPLEIFLYYYGVYPVTSVSFDGTTYEWADVALNADQDRGMLVTENGSIYYGGKLSHADDVDVQVTEKLSTSTLDIEPSVLYALDAGVSKPGLIPYKTKQVVLFYIDAFGYERYEDSAQKGLVVNISSLGEPIKAMAVYPSVSQNNAKAMVTGQPPDLIKADFRGYIPDNETMLDIMDDYGMKPVWVDGTSSPVSVNGTISNVDADKDGTADDEAVDAAIRRYKEGANLVIVHLKSTDLVMHQYGPYSPEGEASMKLADELVGRMMEIWTRAQCWLSGPITAVTRLATQATMARSYLRTCTYPFSYTSSDVARCAGIRDIAAFAFYSIV
jgi:Uncharacterized proteins of the AP superfamily